jgi:hypothetical protein
LERVCREVVLDLFEMIFLYVPGANEENCKNFSQVRWFHGQVLNQLPRKHKSEVLLLDPSCLVHSGWSGLGISVSKVTDCRLNVWDLIGSIDKYFSPSPPCPGQFWGSSSLLSGWSLEVISHLCLICRHRECGAQPPYPSFITWQLATGISLLNILLNHGRNYIFSERITVSSYILMLGTDLAFLWVKLFLWKCCSDR